MSEIKKLTIKEYIPLAGNTECGYTDVRNRMAQTSAIRKLMSIMVLAAKTGGTAESIKKHIFYGKAVEVGTSAATLGDSLDFSDGEYAAIRETLESDTPLRLLHGVLGLVTEAGELAEAVKHHVFDHAVLDRTNVLEELGDMFWYLALMIRVMGGDPEEILGVNIAKLAARYPEKFSEYAALNRDLDKERKILESGQA